MDLSDFKAKLDRAREIEAKAVGATFRLRLPSEHAWRVVTEEHRGSNGRVKQEQVSRALLAVSVLGWEGVTEHHLLLNDGDEPIAFSAEALAMLLDERQDIADELFVALMKRLKERAVQVESARKNLSRAPSGTSTVRPAARS
jgi:hypothetical protein